MFITATTEDLGLPGMKQIVTIPFPYQKGGKVHNLRVFQILFGIPYSRMILFLTLCLVLAV